jgi:hypothetical protein
MRIKVLLNLGAGTPGFRQDEVHDVPDEVGLMLIRQHWAIELPPAPVVVAEAVAMPAKRDKFEAIRQHPDHVTQKPSAHRRRANKQHGDSTRKE